MKKEDVRNSLIVVAAVAGFVGFIVYESVSTGPRRGAVRACLKLIEATNRPGMSDAERIEAARPFLSARLLAAGPIDAIVAGLPRSVARNFEARPEGADFLLHPSGPDGDVYRMVEEKGRWRLDGLVGRDRGEPAPAFKAP